MKNIVLIGMPGCGKTTLGKLIAKRLGADFFDADEETEKNSKMKISEIFSKLGEAAFRDLEHKTLCILSNKQGSVISTGGGCVERKDNITRLRKNGIIVFIDRSVSDILSDINSENRPLLKGNVSALRQLYERRFPLYKEFCDIHIKNTDSIDEVCEKIILEVNKNGR